MGDLVEQLRVGVEPKRGDDRKGNDPRTGGWVDIAATEALMRDAAAEIEHQRKLLDAAKATAVELAMGIRSAYQSELTRLRKIEEAARAYVHTIDVQSAKRSHPQYEEDAIWGDLDYATACRNKLTDLRTSLETKQTDLHNSSQTCDD